MNLFTNNMLRTKRMAWMRDLEWAWHILFTDAFAHLFPVRIISCKAIDKTFFGCSIHHLAQAPPAIRNRPINHVAKIHIKNLINSRCLNHHHSWCRATHLESHAHDHHRLKVWKEGSFSKVRSKDFSRTVGVSSQDRSWSHGKHWARLCKPHFKKDQPNCHGTRCIGAKPVGRRLIDWLCESSKTHQWGTIFHCPADLLQP